MIEQSEILYADGLYDFPQPVQMDITMCSDLDNESREDSGYETHQVTAASNSEMDSGCDESHLSVRQVLTEHVNAEASIFYEPPTPKKKGKQFKQVKSPPVLTSKKRLALHQAKVAEKENIREEKRIKLEEKRAERMKKAESKRISAITKLEKKLSLLKKGTNGGEV